MEGTIGEIRLFAGNFAPRYWAFCNGQLLAIASNTALFSILGTTYGGNGSTTFALPNLQGRTAIHAGGNHSLGEIGGFETVTLLTTQIPSHTHVATAGGGMQTGTGKGENGNPQGNYIDETTVATDLFKAAGGGPIMKGGEGITVTNQPAGNSQPHNNMQPYLCTPYIICMYGIYPSRN